MLSQALKQNWSLPTKLQGEKYQMTIIQRVARNVLGPVLDLGNGVIVFGGR